MTFLDGGELKFFTDGYCGAKRTLHVTTGLIRAQFGPFWTFWGWFAVFTDHNFFKEVFYTLSNTFLVAALIVIGECEAKN